MWERPEKLSAGSVVAAGILSCVLLVASLLTAYTLADRLVTAHQLRQGMGVADGAITDRPQSRARRHLVVYGFTAPDGTGRERPFTASQQLPPSMMRHFPVNTPIRVLYVAGNPARSTIAGQPLWPSFWHLVLTLASILVSGGLGGGCIWLVGDAMRARQRKAAPPAAKARR